ncbi:Putative ATPase [Malassezia caprae]|uniref:ATPase n=1 Tax=Malassezia caprae TaxID=1381934 RepID=A0AAF0E789_9BASI|nr:Putative ATPase [Malassezia caprae]
MAAPLVALCKGCRDVRDQARLYMDRVNLWEMQGNARSVQDVKAGIPAVCVWLAADKASLSKTQQQRLDKTNLLDMAKKVQSGEFLPKKSQEEPPAPEPGAATKHAKQDAKSHPSSSKEKVNHTVPTPKRKREPVEQATIKVPATATPTAGPVSQPAPPRLSKEELFRTRLLSLGLPAYRQGIKFEAEPRRKRGRPPAPKLTPQELSDKQFLASLWAKQPPMQEKKRSMAGLPPRYEFANLSTKELHWMRPMPMPLSIATQDPSGYRLPPTDIWRRWSATMFSSTPVSEPEATEQDERIRKLDLLLQRSSIYSRVMGDKLMKRRDAAPPPKRARTESPVSLTELARREQPSLLTGAKLKPYQMDGLIWLTSLYENGLNGILADEMGLGFAPSIPVLLYHGTKQERARMQKLIQSKKAAVIVTSYDIVLRDRPFLARQSWKYMVVDEGHRLKKLNGKLVHELKQLDSSNRLILTGTPLHNNLAELWSLLNFILPDIFDDLATFEQWFHLEDASEENESISASFASWSTDTAKRVVKQLHEILKPFLLRRVKKEVERDLPPKQEYLLYTPLSVQQTLMYNRALSSSLREWLIARKADLSPEDVRQMEQADPDTRPEPFKMALKEVRAMRLDNTLMQVRKICCHPYLLHWPVVPGTDQLRIDADMVRVCGKMRMLDTLLDALFARKHRVLVFSQFTGMLDILELWATDLKGWKPYRIDGATTQQDRAEQVRAFNEGGASRDLFLLSTRASGLGVNLVGADTVIFFDSDWNPQVDLQAQDRAHRIGQTKPVLVFRLVAQGTIEHDILQKAKAKRLLEAVVIQKGKFLRPITYDGYHDPDTKDDAGLEDLEAHVMQVAGVSDDRPLLSDADLHRLLDRSSEAYARKEGWSSSDGVSTASALFEVTDSQADATTAQLARLLDVEDVDCRVDDD